MANILVPRANNPLTKNSATNVKNTTAVKTPTVTQSNQYMSVNPNIDQIKKQVAAKNNVQSTVIPQNTQTVQNQTTAPVTNTANTSRFIGLNQSTYNPWNNTLQMQQQAQPVVDAYRNKQKLNVPTAVSETKKFNEAEEKKWRTGEQAIMDFQVDVMKNRGKMSEDTIKRLYPEFKDNISSAMELQKELYPIVQSGMGVEASQISQFYPELLAEQKKAAKSIEETQKDVEKANKDSKKFYDRIRKTNLDVLSANGKELANYMLYLEQIPNQLKRKYNINSDASDQEIINYYLSNNPEELEEFNRISNLKLSSYDKAQLGLGGNWMDKFSAGVQRFFNNASNAYQENVSQPLSDVPLIGSLAQVPGGVLQGPNKTLTNMAQLRNGEFNSASDIVGAGIKAGGGALETTFNTAYAPLTAAFNAVGESEVGQKIEENTIGLVPRAITWTFENTPLLKDFYNSLDEEARADLSNELTIALLHGAGSAAKKSGLDIKAGVAAEAVVNALQRGKYASKFQIWLEKGMADENGKFQKGALGRVTKEGWNEFKDALEENFNRFDEVVKAREDLRNPKPVDNNNLPDNRTTGEKIKSEVGNAVEKVKDSVKKANEKAKEKYSNLINNRSKAQEGQGLQSESTLGESKINGNNGSQSGGEINSKPLNKVQTQLIQNYNRMNPKYIQDFEKRYGENYGKFLADRGFTKAGEDNLNDLINYKEQLIDIKSDAITKIEGKFQDQAITDMLDHLVDFYEKTKNRKMLQEFKPMQEQLQREGLTMAQTEKIRKKYSYDIRTEFLKDQANTEKIALANNIYLAMKDFLDKTAKENGLDSLDEINREIMKVQHIIGGITYKLRGSSANNSFTLTDWITAASAVANPEALALLIGKQLLKKNSVRNKVLETLVGRRGNAKNRITSKTIESELERISEINDKKEQDRELTKFYNTYIKPVKELREAYENDVANFKKEFKESVEDGTLSNALEDKRTPEDKSKNQVYGDLSTIEVDEQGTSRRKGSLGEGDKRSDWNKKYGYENTDLAIPEKKTPTEKPTKTTNVVTNGKSNITDKKPEPTQPKNSVMSKKEEKTNTSEEHEQKTEKTANNVIQDPLNVEKGKQLPSNPESKNGKPVVIDSKGKVMEFYHGTPNGGFEKFEMDKRGTTNDISSFGDYGRGIYFTPNLDTAKGYAKHGGEAKNPEIYKVKLYMNNPLRFDIYSEILKESYKIPGNPIGNKEWNNELKKILDKYGVTEEQYEEWSDLGNSLDDNWYDIDVRDYGYDGVVSLDGKEWIVTDENQIEIIGKDGKEKILNEVTKKKPEKKTEDIEAIDNELTKIQQEDLKNMPETEDIEVIDKEIEKKKVTAKYNQEDTTIGQITKHLKDKEKGMKVYKDSEGRIIGQSLVDFNYSAFNIKDKGNTSRVMIQREDNGENIYWMIDPYVTEKGINEINTLLKNIGVNNYHLELRENPVKYAEFKNNVFVINEKTGNEKELSKKYSYDFQGKTNLHNTEITLKRNAEEQAQFEKELAEKQAQREKEKAEYEEKKRQQEAEKARLQAEEDKKREPIKGYLEENYKTPLQRGKVKDNLTKKITWTDDNGKFRVGMTFQWLDELAEKDGEFGEVMVTNTKSQPVYRYDNKGYRLNKTEADYLRYKIDNKSESKPENTPENTVTTEEENHLFKKEEQQPNNLTESEIIKKHQDNIRNKDLSPDELTEEVIETYKEIISNEYNINSTQNGYVLNLIDRLFDENTASATRWGIVKGTFENSYQLRDRIKEINKAHNDAIKLREEETKANKEEDAKAGLREKFKEESGTVSEEIPEWRIKEIVKPGTVFSGEYNGTKDFYLVERVEDGKMYVIRHDADGKPMNDKANPMDFDRGWELLSNAGYKYDNTGKLLGHKKEYQLDNSKKNVISNSKNKVTSK